MVKYFGLRLRWTAEKKKYCEIIIWYLSEKENCEE